MGTQKHGTRTLTPCIGSWHDDSRSSEGTCSIFQSIKNKKTLNKGTDRRTKPDFSF